MTRKEKTWLIIMIALFIINVTIACFHKTILTTINTLLIGYTIGDIVWGKKKR